MTPTSPNELLTAIRRHLIDADIVRSPATADPDLRPCFVEPVNGAPAPGEREGTEDDALAMLSISLSTTLGELPFDTYRRRFSIDFRYRSRGTAGLKAARALDAAIRAELIGRDDYAFGYVLAEGTADALLILSASEWSPLSKLQTDPNGGQTDIAKIVFEIPAE